MQLPILFESLDRISGREGRSKLLQSDSEFYQFLSQLKQKISAQYAVGADRMDLHIEITKERRDPAFRQKATSLQDQMVDLSDPSNWGYLGRAFVLWTPDVADYGRTHATISFFGDHPRPSKKTLIELVQALIAELA